MNSGVVQQQQGPSVEQIINETNQEINNKDIETIIDDTLKKIDEKETDKNTTPTAPATPDTPKQ